jgi:hypothetical protein
MAWTRNRTDTCAYKQFLAESVGEFAYVIDPCRYENQNKQRIAFGIVAGNDVSIVGKNHLCDVESDLFGIDRKLSRCDTLKYINPCPTGEMNTCRPRQIVMRGNPSNHGQLIDLTPYHLPEGQMFRVIPCQLDPFMAGRMPRC